VVNESVNSNNNELIVYLRQSALFKCINNFRGGNKSVVSGDGEGETDLFCEVRLGK